MVQLAGLNGCQLGLGSSLRLSEVPLRNAREHYAVLLALGEYALSEIPDSRRDALLKQLADTYRNDPSSGVHGAAGWLLRQWGQVNVVREVDQTAIPYSTGREWFTLAITVTPTSAPAPKKKPVKENADKETKDEQTTESDETKKADVENAKSEPLPQKTFYYTFVVFPAGESKIGSVSDESERRKRSRPAQCDIDTSICNSGSRDNDGRANRF